jgi:hypothetical protein
VSIFFEAVSSVQIAMSLVFPIVGFIRRNMAKESPAEKMHNRILSGAAFSTRDVTAGAFESVARRAGTLGLSDIKAALEKLRVSEKSKRKA